MRLYLITHVKRCQDKNMKCHRNPSSSYDELLETSALCSSMTLLVYTSLFSNTALQWAQLV
jgi:hypothetical protein